MPLGNITINTIQTHKQHISFDGQHCTLPLDYPPLASKPVAITFSSGMSVAYRFIRQSSHSPFEVVIDDDLQHPTITFSLMFKPGLYEVEYSYDMSKHLSKALLQSLANVQLSHYGSISPSGILTYTPAEQEPSGYIQVPSAFAEEHERKDYITIKEAMLNGNELDFSQCTWIVYHKDAFPEGEYDEWYQYALEHCPRFAKEQPKR
jgi:hypothetical protein